LDESNGLDPRGHLDLDAAVQCRQSDVPPLVDVRGLATLLQVWDGAEFIMSNPKNC
jgi:hypothetical protein